MITRSMKKILASAAVATYLLSLSAPIAFCEVVNDSNTQPAEAILRGPASVENEVKVNDTKTEVSAEGSEKESGTIHTAEVEANELQKKVESGEQSELASFDDELSSLKLEGEISITTGNPKISLSLRDSDVKQVLRMFSDKAGLNIIFHSSVDGEVTLDLVNVPLNDAFKLVMQVTDLTYYVDKNTMVVASASSAKSMNLSKQEMTAIPVKYTDASVMAEFLNKNIFGINKPGLSNSEIAITNPGANEVLIFGTDNDVKMAQKIIEKFDSKPKSTTIAVNHTTPAEMADLICNVLLKSEGGGSSGGSSSGGEISIGAGTIACEYGEQYSAGSLASLNDKNLTVSYFAQRGTINIQGGADNQVQMIKDFIKQNDKKQPQAYLEVSIIELSESGTRQFDNTWQVLSKNFSATFNGQTATNPAYPTFFKNNSIDIVNEKQEVQYSISQFAGTPTVTYAMNYIMENGKGRVLANPRVIITNGETSSIDLTSDYVKSVTSQVMSGSLAGAVQKTYDIANDDGMKIELTPFISPDGYVTLNITPEYATIKEKVYSPSAADPTKQDLQATLLQRRNLELKNVRIKDGETLVIGGMIREDETKTIKKIPVLGDLPGIGFFFRNTQTTKTKSELVLMITPKIIKDSEDMLDDTNVTL